MKRQRRAFVASLDIATDDTVTGAARLQDTVPRDAPLTFIGEVKQEGERRWLELRCEYVPRQHMKLKHSQQEPEDRRWK